MKKYYAGIGSRETPRNIQLKMTQLATILERKGYILRSGGAVGADSAFARGVSDESHKEIFRSGDCTEWCFAEAKKYIPPGSPAFDTRPDCVKRLLGRNVQIILGRNGDLPVEFVVCWMHSITPIGGTGHGVRCADAYGIPSYNLFSLNNRRDLVIDILSREAYQ